LLILKGVQLAYDDHIVFQDVSLELSPGSRIGLLGPNGAGKSSLIKLMSGMIAPKKGERIVAGRHTKLAYYSQHQVDALDLSASPLAHIVELSPNTTEQAARNFLGGFAFSGDMALNSIEYFSGGEKARLALALLVWQKPNLLLLDEPTNHLDLDMRGALEIALQSYEGAMVVVSHDRHLLRSSVDEFLLVHDQCVEKFKGDLNDYERWLLDTRKRKTNVVGDEKTTGKEIYETNKAKRRRKEKGLRLEKQIEQLNKSIADVDEQLADNTLYQPENKQQLFEVQQKKEKLRAACSVVLGDNSTMCASGLADKSNAST